MIYFERKRFIYGISQTVIESFGILTIIRVTGFFGIKADTLFGSEYYCPAI